MRLPLAIHLTVQLSLSVLPACGRDPQAPAPKPAPSASAPARAKPAVPVVKINDGYTWVTDEPVGTLGDVSAVRIGDSACILNTRTQWVPCTLNFFDTNRQGIWCTRIDLPPFGAIRASAPAVGRPVGFMQITVPMGGCAIDPEGGPHVIGFASEALTIPLLKQWGFLKEGAACPESAILQDAPDIQGPDFVLIVVGRTVSYSFPVTPVPGADAAGEEEHRLKLALDMIAKVREEDAAAANLNSATKSE